MNTAFGQTLKRRRERRKLTQEQLADASGIHAQTVSRLERGEMEPTLSSVFALAKALRCSPADLVGR